MRKVVLILLSVLLVLPAVIVLRLASLLVGLVAFGAQRLVAAVKAWRRPHGLG